MNTVKMSVEEIRNVLINEYNRDINEINNIKGKAKLANLLVKVYNEDVMKNNETFTITDVEDPEERTLNRQDRDWSKYILDQLSDDEKDGIYPKADGLRRLLEKEVASIISIDNDIRQVPCTANGMVATVKSHIILSNGEEYSALADAKKSDLEYPYDMHITAIAETRAEGRVYRKALRLKNTVTKEEMVEKIEDAANKINKNQIMILDTLCMNNRLNINIQKLLELIFKENIKSNIREYSHEDATLVTKQLTEYQADMDKIPQEILGYDPNWRL